MDILGLGPACERELSPSKNTKNTERPVHYNLHNAKKIVLPEEREIDCPYQMTSYDIVVSIMRTTRFSENFESNHMLRNEHCCFCTILEKEVGQLTR